MKHERPLIDSYGRRITYLRVSLTEACNFRCVYCVPVKGFPNLPNACLLSVQEIERFVRIAGRLGIGRVRLTGGEPLLRPDIIEIVRTLKRIDTVRDLSITTNASRLAPLVWPLKKAGLDRMNISLDSVDPERFRKVTRSDSYDKVWEATRLALLAGFPVKLNMVVLKGLTAAEIVRFVQLAVQYPLEVRFLEFMPLCGPAWQQDLVLPIRTVRAVVGENFDLREVPRGEDVAQVFRVQDGKGRVGFIASLTESFCDRCSRIRLSADGRIFPCLFSEAQVSVKQLLKERAPDEAIIKAIRLAAAIKPRGNRFHENPFTEDPERDFVPEPAPLIRQIGG